MNNKCEQPSPDPDPPGIRRIRARGHYDPKPTRKRNRDPEARWETGQQMRNKVLLLLVPLSLACVVGGVMWVVKLGRGDAAQEESSQTAIEEAFQGAIEDTVAQFLNAATAEERCKWVIGGLSRSPNGELREVQEMKEKIEDYYTRRGVERPGGFGRIAKLDQEVFQGVPMYVALAVDLGTVNRPIFNLFPAHTRLLIEWESSVGYGEMQWEEFIRRRPAIPTQMRVYLSRDDTYAGRYADENKYVSFKVEYRDGAQSLQGYAERDSDLGRQLLEAVPSLSPQAVNVRLRFPEDSIQPVVVIDEFLHSAWIDREHLNREFDNW